MNKEKETTQMKFGEIELEMEKVEDATFFKFENIGDSIFGILMEKAESGQYGFGLYTVQTPDGETLRFHGTTQLDTLMSNVEIHDYVYVEYVDNQKTTMPSPMKLFKVSIGKQKIKK